MKPICTRCRVEYRVERNGVLAVEMSTRGVHHVWQADRWQCPSCLHELIDGRGLNPVASGHEASMEYLRAHHDLPRHPYYLNEYERSIASSDALFAVLAVNS